MNEIREVVLDGEIVKINPNLLCFNETNLNEFMENYSLNYDYYSSKLALAENIMSNCELESETEYMRKFAAFKSEGMSDKAADSMSRIDNDYLAKQKKLLDSKNNFKQLKEFVRALDKVHEMSQSRGHMLRKEMDKLRIDINNSHQTLDDILN